MATATSLSNPSAGTNAWDAIAASQTDSALIAAGAGTRIVITSVMINQGDTTASAVTFNSKGAGVGTAISPALKAGANGVMNLHPSKGWFSTNVGEGLTVTTGAGSTTNVFVTYVRR